MVADNELLMPVWPEPLQLVDIVQACFDLDFVSPCKVQPADFLGIGGSLRIAARRSCTVCDEGSTQKSHALFQPVLSDDPIARRKFQKPAPAFVINMPIMQEKLFFAGDRLELEVLFVGAGIPLITDFLNSLIHLGHQGLANGEGVFHVTQVHTRQTDHYTSLAWSQPEPVSSLTCVVQPLIWLLQNQHVKNIVTIKYLTPTRLMADGKPLRNPSFFQIFPFMLRRATSMLYAHGGIELVDEPTQMLQMARELDVLHTQLCWQDWRALSGKPGITVGGFVGEMTLEGHVLEEVYWVLAVASLFGLGKGATYGAGRFVLGP
jgi:hypothetical protein